jgi:hypothetical protein
MMALLRQAGKSSKARFVTTRQKEPNEKCFVGYETTWEPFQKEAPYTTPKKP